MDTAAELGRNPVSKHQIQPEYGDEQADVGRDCRTRLARPIIRREREQGSIHFPCSADHEQDWQLTRLLYVMAIYTYIHNTRFSLSIENEQADAGRDS